MEVVSMHVAICVDLPYEGGWMNGKLVVDILFGPLTTGRVEGHRHLACSGRVRSLTLQLPVVYVETPENWTPREEGMRRNT